MFGISNWVRTLSNTPPWWASFREALFAEMGDPVTDSVRLRRISPLIHAEKIKVPLMVLQGANDPRVLKVESDDIVTAAKKNGVPVEYVVFPDEGHGFVKGGVRTKLGLALESPAQQRDYFRYRLSTFLPQSSRRSSYDQDSALEVFMNRRLALRSSLLLLLWASVACSTRPEDENANALATSHIFGGKQVTLPPGTAVTVRLASAVGSKLSPSGGHFSAIVVRPVEVNGKVIVPAGAEALGRIVEAVPHGRFQGAAELRLVLETVTLNKDSYDVQTSSISRYQKGKGKRTATFIGAALGGGAGTGGVAYTEDKEIVLPRESALSFTLTEPVTITM
jgi:Prolyl oligopeptidase family